MGSLWESVLPKKRVEDKTLGEHQHQCEAQCQRWRDESLSSWLSSSRHPSGFTPRVLQSDTSFSAIQDSLGKESTFQQDWTLTCPDQGSSSTSLSWLLSQNLLPSSQGQAVLWSLLSCVFPVWHKALDPPLSSQSDMFPGVKESLNKLLAKFLLFNHFEMSFWM